MLAMQDRITRRFRRVTDDGERGLTLVELLVAILIFGLLLVMVGGAFSTISRTITLATNTNQNVSFSSLGMSEMQKVLRFASTNPVLGNPLDDPAFVSVNNEALTVYSYVDASASNPVPVKVSFALDSQRRLVETRYSAYSVATGYYAFNATPYLTRILTGTVLAPATGEPYLFTYLDANNNALATSTLTTQTAIRKIAAVQVRLKIKGNTTNGANPIVLTNTVGLPNLGISRTGQDI